MKWNEKILKEDDIQQIYLDLINEYGKRLPEYQKHIAKEIFQKLYNTGKTWEWIYWAIWQLGERQVVNNKGLFFYSDYQKEVDDIVKYANQYFNTGLTMEQYMEDYVQWLVLYDKDNMDNELFSRLSYFDNKYWNTEEEFAEEETEELVLYYKQMLKEQLQVSRKEYEQEQRSIAKELRRIYGGVYDVPPHPFVNMDLYIKEVPEEDRKRGIAIGFYKE